MEGAAGDPYRRPARRTQWLLSALAHHYGLDRGVENEIVVLATGLDQYLQEVFHHLDCRGAGRLPRADFRVLCAVLGLRADGAAAGDADLEEEARLALRAEPAELTFRQFHARLCGYFGARAGPRLPRGTLSEHVETQIRLRRPRRRRPPGAPGPGDPGDPRERAARLEEENGSLRELVEDLRAALQSSDARCLALQVGLWKSRAGALAAGRGGPEAAAEVRRRAEEARRAVLRSLRRVRELEALARRGRGPRGRLRLLKVPLPPNSAKLQTKPSAHWPLGNIPDPNYSTIKRSEDPELPTPPGASPVPGQESGEPEDSGAKGPGSTPGGAWPSDSSSGSRALDEADEQLLRSVEGRAASEEDEEERPPEGQAGARRERPSGCRSGCEDQTATKPRTDFGHCGGATHACTLGEPEAPITRLGEQRQTQGCAGKSLGTPEEEVGRAPEGPVPPSQMAELQRMAAENEQLRLELQVVETERVRLSLLEEKLEDVLQLLQQLRDLNISKRALGKILLSTLDTCRDPTQEGRPGPSATLDTLHQALAGCELLQRRPPAPASTAPVSPSPLLLSC